MKKIVCYIDCMGMGGANRVMANLTEWFSGNGYDVILVNDTYVGNWYTEYQVADSVRRCFLYHETRWRIMNNLQRIADLRKIIQAERPDVVLSFMCPPNVRLLLATINLPCRIIVSVRNDPNREYGKGIRKWLIRRLFTLSDGVVFQTDDAACYFQKSIRDRSVVIPNPVSDDFFDMERCATPCNVVTVGRMDAQKNHKLLIEAWSLIEHDYPEHRLVIYGDGPLRGEYEKQLRQLGISDRIDLPGKVSNIQKHLSEAAVFVLSSDFEGMPNALMEAMAVGVPSISTDCPCGGSRALISNGVNGLLVPCNDLVALSEAIKNLLDNPSQAERLSEQARCSSVHYRFSAVMKEWEQFLFDMEKTDQGE